MAELKKFKNCYNLFINKDIEENIYNEFAKSLNDSLIEIQETKENNDRILREIGYPTLELTKEKLPQFNIYLSTYGGAVHHAYGIYDMIRELSKNYIVNIYCRGFVMSAGIIILCAGENRYSYPNTTFMVHQILGWMFGKLEDMKEDVIERERLQEIMNHIITSSTSITQSQLDEWFKYKKDVYLSPQQALEYGLIDKIL